MWGVDLTVANDLDLILGGVRWIATLIVMLGPVTLKLWIKVYKIRLEY
jgi:hypothetical protein